MTLAADRVSHPIVAGIYIHAIFTYLKNTAWLKKNKMHCVYVYQTCKLLNYVIDVCMRRKKILIYIYIINFFN